MFYLLPSLLPAFRLLFHRLVYQTVIVKLLDISPFGLGMLDKFQRIRHGLLYNPEGRRERVLVKVKGALQFRIVLGSGKFSQRSLGYYSIFSSQSLSFIERA